MDAFKLMKELKANYEQEINYLPKETGLSLIESTTQVGRNYTFHPDLDFNIYFNAIPIPNKVTQGLFALNSCHC